MENLPPGQKGIFLGKLKKCLQNWLCPNISTPLPPDNWCKLLHPPCQNWPQSIHVGHKTGKVQNRQRIPQSMELPILRPWIHWKNKWNDRPDTVNPQRMPSRKYSGPNTVQHIHNRNGTQQAIKGRTNSKPKLPKLGNKDHRSTAGLHPVCQTHDLAARKTPQQTQKQARTPEGELRRTHQEMYNTTYLAELEADILNPQKP